MSLPTYNSVKGFPFFHILANTSHLFFLLYPLWQVWSGISLWLWGSLLLLTNDVKQLANAIGHLNIFSRKMSVQVLCPLLHKNNNLKIFYWMAWCFCIMWRLCCAELLSSVKLFATLWTVARQAPLSMGFSRQEYWSGLPCPPPGDLPKSGIETRSTILQADSLPSEAPRKPKSLWIFSSIL